MLVSWQAFTATGLFCGSIFCYILRGHWQSQYLSGAVPSVLLLATVFGSCESPRWLILRGYYDRAYTTLVRLRGERVLAAKELVSIRYQIQAERRVFLNRQVDRDKPELNPFDSAPGRATYWERLRNMFVFPRIRRAAIAAMIVQISQTLSGINILAFMATQFIQAFGSAHFDYPQTDYVKPPFVNTNCSNLNNTLSNLTGTLSGLNITNLNINLTDLNINLTDSTVSECVYKQVVKKEEASSLLFAIGFGLANMVFSIVAYFLVENSNPQEQNSSTLDDNVSPTQGNDESVDPDEYNDKQKFRGRRFLLLTSLAGGAVTLFLTSTIFILDKPSVRNPLVYVFMIIFTAFYSPGAGAIPFLYCAEIFPNEGRELGMSWSTFCNFFGAGLLALAVPHGIHWSPGKLLAIFSATNVIAFVLVYFFVPGTNHTATLEDMNYVFSRKLRDHARENVRPVLVSLQPVWSLFQGFINRHTIQRRKRNTSQISEKAESTTGKALAEQHPEKSPSPIFPHIGSQDDKRRFIHHEERPKSGRRIKSSPSALT